MPGGRPIRPTSIVVWRAYDQGILRPPAYVKRARACTPTFPSSNRAAPSNPGWPDWRAASLCRVRRTIARKFGRSYLFRRALVRTLGRYFFNPRAAAGHPIGRREARRGLNTCSQASPRIAPAWRSEYVISLIAMDQVRRRHSDQRGFTIGQVLLSPSGHRAYSIRDAKDASMMQRKKARECFRAATPSAHRLHGQSRQPLVGSAGSCMTRSASEPPLGPNASLTRDGHQPG